MVMYVCLQSENVLVWSLPSPQEAEEAEASPDPIDVHIKLGDYGIIINKMFASSFTK